jgi:hypothetical protein
VSNQLKQLVNAPDFADYLDELDRCEGISIMESHGCYAVRPRMRNLIEDMPPFQPPPKRSLSLAWNWIVLASGLLFICLAGLLRDE